MKAQPAMGPILNGPSNLDYVAATFRQLPLGVWPTVVSIKGDIKDRERVNAAAWKGQPGREDAVRMLNEQNNNYCSLAAFSGGERSKQNFVGLYAVGLDDVGTKATMPDNSPVPSYRVRTSPGNEQWIYLLNEPCTSLDTATRVGAWLASKGYTDVGAKDLATRILRLPRGVNGKAEHGSEGFAHEVLHWNPELRYSLDGLAHRLGLDLTRDPPSGNPRRQPESAANASKFHTTSWATDADVTHRILGNAKGRAVWNGDDAGLGGSEADQYLVTRIAYLTQDRQQIARIYSNAPRAGRKSSDGTQKWKKREDYRERCISNALSYLDEHPIANLEEATALVEDAIAATERDGDNRRLTSIAVMDAMAILLPGDADFFRGEMKLLGVRLGTLDKEIKKARGNVAGQRDLTDKEAADQVIEKLGGRGRVSYCGGQLWTYREQQGIWQPIMDDEVRHLSQTVMPMHQVTAAKVRSVTEVAKASAFSRETFDAITEKNSICLSNGVLRLERECIKLVPHDPSYRHTSQVPVVWQESALCPNFDAFVSSIFAGDRDAAEKAVFLRRAIGYSLTTSTDLEKFVLLYGPSSSNGKSTLLKLIAALAGKVNVAAVSVSRLGGRFDMAQLQNRLVNLTPELERGEVLPANKIKEICSGDLQTAERKGKDHFEFRPYATLWMSANHLPAMKDFSPALIEKRCVLLSFNQTFKGREDMGLEARLLGELPGILAQCAKAYGDALATARHVADVLPEPPSSVEAKAAWRQESDPVQLFCDECLTADNTRFTGSNALWKTWEAWREANGVKLGLSRKALTQGVLRVLPGARSGDGARRGGVRGLAGVALVMNWSDDGADDGAL